MRYVSYGSIASFGTRSPNVCLFPNSGGRADISGPQLRAFPDSCTAARDCHSITSSARASNGGGIVMPSALAVLRFRNSSNFDGPLNYTCGMSSSKADAASAVVRRAPPDFEDWETVRTLILEAFA